MSTRQLANQLLESFGRLLTIEGLELGEKDDSCVLLFDQDLALTIEYDEPTERLLFAVYLDSLTEETEGPLLRELLSANFYWIATAGATLCAESSTGALYLLYPSRVTDLDDARFERLVENLISMAEKWRDRIAAHRAGTVTAAADSASNGADTLPLSSTPHIFG